MNKNASKLVSYSNTQWFIKWWYLLAWIFEKCIYPELTSPKLLSQMHLTLLLLRSGRDKTEFLKSEAYCPHAGQISIARRNIPLQILPYRTVFWILGPCKFKVVFFECATGNILAMRSQSVILSFVCFFFPWRNGETQAPDVLVQNNILVITTFPVKHWHYIFITQWPLLLLYLFFHEKWLYDAAHTSVERYLPQNVEIIINFSCV